MSIVLLAAQSVPFLAAWVGSPFPHAHFIEFVEEFGVEKWREVVGGSKGNFVLLLHFFLLKILHKVGSDEERPRPIDCRRIRF